ncbi:hypothetical protein NRB_49830 [Novosphingobium sp. 11B]
MTEPMSDDALIAIAQHRFEQADRDCASEQASRLLLDIFPAVLQRLREKVELTREFVAADRGIVDAPKGWGKQAAAAKPQADDGQIQLSLLHL